MTPQLTYCPTCGVVYYTSGWRCAACDGEGYSNPDRYTLIPLPPEATSATPQADHRPPPAADDHTDPAQSGPDPDLQAG